MDELKMSLSTKFMKGIVTKIISKAILKKTGYNINIIVRIFNIIRILFI